MAERRIHDCTCFLISLDLDPFDARALVDKPGSEVMAETVQATPLALDKGRRLLDALPYPENCDHHFVVDPMKFDYYAMDCYRTVGADSMAEHLAEEVIEANTDYDGLERAPMRMSEARITLGVVRARAGDLEGAVNLGMRALVGEFSTTGTQARRRPKIIRISSPP